MSSKYVGIPTSDGGLFDAYVSMPVRKQAPGVVMIPEIFGINEGLRRCADLFARQGFAVLAPDIFWRLGRNVELDYSEASYKKAFALHRAFDYEQGVADMANAFL